MAEEFEKGARVEVIGGRKSKGVVGTVFWVGDNTYGEGKRYGIKGDDGETHWVPGQHLGPARAEAALEDGPEWVRGDRVAWGPVESERWGEVFWVGASKRGPGVRVGVKDAQGESLWFDARQLRAPAGDAPPVAGDDEPPFHGEPPFDPEPPAFDEAPPARFDEEPPAWDDAPGVPEGFDDEEPPF